MKNIFLLLALFVTCHSFSQNTNLPDVIPLGGNVQPYPTQAVYNTVYVSKSGNDATGQRARPDFPFLTITGAKGVAQKGDTIIVAPGVYNENNLLKVGVNYQLGTGVVLSYMPPTNDTINVSDTTAYGIFDDRSTGPTTNLISGGDLVWNAGTNYNVDTNTDTVYWGNVNALGPIVMTNALTQINATFKTIQVSAFYSGSFAFYVRNCTNSILRFTRIYDPYAGRQIATTNVLNAGIFSTGSYSSAVYWELGDCYVAGDFIDEMSQYALDAYGGTNSEIVNLWMNVTHIRGKVYVVGFGSANWRTWIQSDEVECTANTQNVPFEYHGSGKHYVYVNKVESVGANPDFIVVTNTGVTAILNLWVTAQKLSSKDAWIIASYGTNYFNVQHFEELASPSGAAGIQTSSHVVLTVNGGAALKTTGQVISHTAGTARINDMYINSALNFPVVVAGSGLTIRGGSIVSPSGTNSIYSAASQTVGILGQVMATVAKHANITLSPLGTYTVDSNVQ